RLARAGIRDDAVRIRRETPARAGPGGDGETAAELRRGDLFRERSDGRHGRAQGRNPPGVRHRGRDDQPERSFYYWIDSTSGADPDRVRRSARGPAESKRPLPFRLW